MKAQNRRKVVIIMLKKVFSLFLGLTVGVLILGLATIVFASNNMISVVRNGINVIVNRQEIKGDNFLYNDRTYVPLREIAENLDCVVDWDENSYEVRMYSEEYDKELFVEDADLNYKGVYLDMSLDQAKQLLGEPNEMITRPEEGNLGSYEHYAVYDTCKLKIYYDDSGSASISSIEVLDKSFQTNKGIHVGARRLDLIHKYGRPQSGSLRYSEVNHRYDDLAYWNEKGTSRFVFEINDDSNISKITISWGGR